MAPECEIPISLANGLRRAFSSATSDLTPEERRYNAFLTPVLIPFDISVIQAKDADELVSEVGRIAARQGDLAELSQKQLLAANASIPDVNYRSVRNLLDR